ncbi:MAG: hypothetical protein JWM95_4803 [Gemmatimonadetes bacterium]|nr:hypothetical protein [Gemmatimonadota bacterium]
MAAVIFKMNARRIASWVGSIPMHSRHCLLSPPISELVIPQLSGSRRSIINALAFTALVAVSASAQRADSARVAPKAPPQRPRSVVDTATKAGPKPPISPRRAFLYSALAPGFGQSKLGRPTAGAIFVFTESIALAMLRESKADLREARLFQTDSLVTLGADPITGEPIVRRSPYNESLVNIRRGHVEDWVAFLIANHLFSGADAYVAAHLWDLPSQIIVSQAPTGTRIGARIRW